MDYDSSSKFISSLAKFLQSLCNGYVEFDNGVEVIGHIYLSVDTGKKIDYILNEKVCKTDENSVTFISNSFHAQPAEKPKPNPKKGRGGDHSESVENVVEIEEGSNDIEPRSTNMGTIPRNLNRNLQSSSPGHRKRPFSPHSKGGPSSTKKGRSDTSQEQLSFGVSDEGNVSFSAANTSSDPLRGHSHQSSSLPPSSSQSYDPSYHTAPDNSSVGNSEDIKPSMDTDVTFVKEEFGSSQAEEDKSQGIDDSFSSMYSNQPFSEGPPGPSFSHQNSRLSYGGERSDNGLYDANMMSSQLDGGDGGAGSDPSGSKRRRRCKSSSVKAKEEGKKRGRRPAVDGMVIMASEKTCEYCGKTYNRKSELTRHKWKCQGLRNLPCEYCQAVFHRKDHLRKHLEKHIGKEILQIKPEVFDDGYGDDGSNNIGVAVYTDIISRDFKWEEQFVIT